MPTQGGGTPAKRKAPAKRGPTKAQALKALGLTQEDLNALKQLREVQAAVEQTQEEVKKQPDAKDPQQFLEDRPGPTPSPTPPAEEGEPVFYERNLRGVEVNYRKTRQQKQGERRTALKPRGQRGDLKKLEPGDLRDSEVQTQVAYSLIEIIPEGEALEILKKQGYNATQGVPAHIAALRNELGKPYEQGAIQVARDESYKVADLKPVVEGEYGEIQVGPQGPQREIRQNAPTGGNPHIISDGFTQGVPQMGGVDQNAMAQDALARSKAYEGPGAGTGEVIVKVTPTVRT